MTQTKTSFASDNYSPVMPEVMGYLNGVNIGHVTAYGNDEYSAQARQIMKNHLKLDHERIYFVFSGTAANVISVKASIKSYQSVICADSCHLNVNEGAAPEAVAGSKMIAIKNTNGKITAAEIEQTYLREKSVYPHAVTPGMVTIAQSTELGTTYSLEELKAIREVCDKLELILHIDACRAYNAAVFLNCELSDIIKFADIASVGGTKNGLMMAESVIVNNERLNHDFLALQKQTMQLYSKMRYLSSQYIPFFEQGLWKKAAENSNRMTKLLAEGLQKFPEIKINQPVEANHIFASMPKDIIPRLQEQYFFYEWDATINEVRLVTSWDTKEEDVNGFLELLANLLNKN